jgi:hypothetical protein
MKDPAMKDDRENTELDRPGHINSDLLLMEVAERNPSLGGRELLLEIIERGPMPEGVERSQARDHRAAFKTSPPDDPDYRTPIEQADWLGKESQEMRDMYERGAVIKENVLVIPAEEYELRDDRDTPFITTLSYAQKRIGDIEQAREFHSLALEISGETADTKADSRDKIAVFKSYYDRIARDEKDKWYGEDWKMERWIAVKDTLEEMRIVASEMAKIETRESIEVVQAERIEAADNVSNRADNITGSGMNVSARKVNLRDESLRFPAGLSYETKERLVRLTMPEIDHRLEKGVDREALFKAIDNTMFRRSSPEITEKELEERGKIGRFLKDYIDERLREPETRSLNFSADFRKAREAIIKTTTPEALGSVAGSILSVNDHLNKELYHHHSDPDHHRPPKQMPLSARELKLLFNGRAPDHHTKEMRELRINYGLSRAERTDRLAALREGRIEPSEALKTILQEMETRKTVNGLSHFQASLLREEVSKKGRVNLYQLHKRLSPHERTYLFELSEDRKWILQRLPRREENLGSVEKGDEQLAGRAFGSAPRESRAFQEYIASMGRIERQLLNEAVRRQTVIRDQVSSDRDGSELTITEARNLLPERVREEIRLKARNQAWQSLVPEEVFDKNPLHEALQISDTIAHIQENLQERARIAQTARNDFLAEKIRIAEEQARAQKDGQKMTLSTAEERDKFVRSVLDSLPPDSARKLAALNRYADKAREEVYRGFELLDAQFRALEIARVKESFREETVSFALPMSEKLSVNGFSESQAAGNADHDHLIVAQPQIQESDQKIGTGMDGFQMGKVHADKEWHFDSLKEVLAVGLEEAQEDGRMREELQRYR